LPANKLIVSDEQKDEIKKYVKKGLTGAKIAHKLGVSQSTMWRVMEDMGLNKKKIKQKKIKKKKPKLFNWSNFKGNSVM